MVNNIFVLATVVMGIFASVDCRAGRSDIADDSITTLAARANQTASKSIPATTQTRINFDTVDFDTDATITTGSNWHFTAPVAGKYRVSALVTIDLTSAFTQSKYALLQVRKGSGTGTFVATLGAVTGNSSGAAPAEYFPIGGSTTVALAANDEIFISVYHYAGSTVSTKADGELNHVSIERVSN